jgi:hypothetical protein
MNKIQPVDYNVFQGTKYQRGYGIGNVFKRLYKWIVPIFEQKGIPILKTLGKTIIKGTTNFADDAIEGKNIKTSAKRRFEESLNELSDKAGVMSGEGLHHENHINKKRKTVKFKQFKKRKENKRNKDIFD